MKFLDTEICTPLDDPAYQLNWRSRVAEVCRDGFPGVTPRLIRQDADIRAYQLHLRYRARNKLVGQPLPLDRIAAWRTSPTGRLLEAYLLTQAAYAEIASRTSTVEADVKGYERLFFAVRDEAGHPVQSVLSRLRSEQQDPPDPLKKAALAGGRAGLVAELSSTDDTDDLSVLVDRELRRRLRAGNLRNGELIQMHRTATIIAQAEVARQPQGETAGIVSAMMSLLTRTAPRMVEVERTAEQTSALNSEIRGRLESQQASNKMAPAIVAKSESDLDDLIKRKVVRGT